MEKQTPAVKPTAKPHAVKHRSIPLAIVFSVITCGIYGLYWFVCLTNDTNSLSKYKTASGGLAIVYTLLTCGIYSFYWHYMLGKKVGEIESDSSHAVMYLVLDIFFLGFINFILAQSALNRT